MVTKRNPEMKARRTVHDFDRQRKIDIRGKVSHLSGRQAAIFRELIKGGMGTVKIRTSVQNVNSTPEYLHSGYQFEGIAKPVHWIGFNHDFEGDVKLYNIELIEKLIKENNDSLNSMRAKNEAIKEAFLRLKEVNEKTEVAMLPSMSMEELKALSDRMYAVTLEEMQRELYDDAE